MHMHDAADIHASYSSYIIMHVCSITVVYKEYVYTCMHACMTVYIYIHYIINEHIYKLS